MNNKFTLKKLLIPAVALIIMIIGAIVYPFNNKLEVSMIYGDVMNGSGLRVYYDTGVGITPEKSKFGEVADFGAHILLKSGTGKITQLGVAPTDIQEVCSVRNVTITVNEDESIEIPASTFDSCFTPVNANGYYDEATDQYYFLPSGDMAYLSFDSAQINAQITPIFDNCNSDALRTRITCCFLIVIILTLIFWNFDKLEQMLDDIFDSSKGVFVPIAVIGFVIATITVMLIAFRTPLGGLHPDEYDVVECLKYGMNHLIPPDIRDPEVAGTFSGYGYTKLENGTYYFLIAGKVAALAKLLWATGNWWRIPNVLLFLGMAVIFFKNIRKKNYLVLTLGISVQAWYIFSYTTADALDFFFSFLVLMLLTDEESMLNKLIRDGLMSKNIIKAILIGVLFGMVFIGKQNYWAILLLAFVALLFKLLDAPKEERGRIWKVYIFVLAVFVVTVGTRYAFDFAHYGMNGSKIKDELIVQYSAYDRNPTTPVQDLAVSWKMYAHGYSIADFFAEIPMWFTNSFHSFCGLLNDYETSQVYFSFAGFLYCFIMIVLAGITVRKDASKRTKIEVFICMGIMALSVIVSIGNSYFVDSQYQGRYLLPMALTLGYIGYKTPEAFEKKYFKAAVIILNVLCVWYFATRAVAILGVPTLEIK